MSQKRPLLSLFARRRQDEFPDKNSPEYQYTEAVLERHKREGLELAVRVRWVAMAAIGILMLFLVPFPEVLYIECILALLALNGWLMRRVGRVGQSKTELLLIFFDLALMTYGMVGPNPLSDHTWPHAMQYRFDNFPYFFVILAGGGVGVFLADRDRHWHMDNRDLADCVGVFRVVH